MDRKKYRILGRIREKKSVSEEEEYRKFISEDPNDQLGQTDNDIATNEVLPDIEDDEENEEEQIDY